MILCESFNKENWDSGNDFWMSLHTLGFTIWRLFIFSNSLAMLTSKIKVPMVCLFSHYTHCTNFILMHCSYLACCSHYQMPFIPMFIFIFPSFFCTHLLLLFPLSNLFLIPLTFFTCQVQMHSPTSTSLIILSQSLNSTKSTQVTKSIIMLCCQYKFPVQYDICYFRFPKVIYIDVCHCVPKEATFQFH